MTNGDKIRQMSDDELISFIGRCVYAGYEPWCGIPFCDNFDKCGECLTEWLKQDVEE